MSNQKEEINKALFYYAVDNENRDMLKLVSLEYTPRISTKDIDLESYCKNNNLLNVKYIALTSENNNTLNELLCYASKFGRLNIVKCVHKYGADIHIENDFALELASEHGHLDIVKYLIKNGVTVNAYDDIAVRTASQYGHLEVVKYLITKGADIHSYNNYAIKCARKNGHLDVVEFLETI